MQDKSLQNKLFTLLIAVGITVLLVAQGSLNSNESVDISFSEFESLLKTNGIQHVNYKDKEITLC